MRTFHPHRRGRGFTLIELIVVILILGILAAIAVVGYNGMADRATEARAQLNLSNVAKATYAQAHTTGADELDRPLIRAAIEEHFPDAGDLPVIPGLDAADGWALLGSSDAPTSDVEFAAGFDQGAGTRVTDAGGSRAAIVTAADSGGAVFGRVLIWNGGNSSVGEAVKYPAGTTPADVLNPDAGPPATPDPPEAPQAALYAFDRTVGRFVPYADATRETALGTPAQRSPALTFTPRANLQQGEHLPVTVVWPDATEPMTLTDVSSAAYYTDGLAAQTFPGAYVQGACLTAPVGHDWYSNKAVVGQIALELDATRVSTMESRFLALPETVSVDLASLPCLGDLVIDGTYAEDPSGDPSYVRTAVTADVVGGVMTLEGVPSLGLEGMNRQYFFTLDTHSGDAVTLRVSVAVSNAYAGFAM